jgi:hypothetical protein
MGRGGTTGAAGRGGTTGGGTGPCAGLCSPAMPVAKGMNSGDLGTAATCHELTGATMGTLNCGNFVAPRTFSINGMDVSCVGNGGTYTLPAPRNGGWCLEASAGDFAWAWFGTFSLN